MRVLLIEIRSAIFCNVLFIVYIEVIVVPPAVGKFVWRSDRLTSGGAHSTMGTHIPSLSEVAGVGE